MARASTRALADAGPGATSKSAGARGRLLALLVIYLVVGHMLPPPADITPAGWRTTAVVLSTIAGLMLQPLPGAAIVLLGLSMLVLVGGVSMTRALSGFSSPSVWLIVPAMLMARALRDTGLARRIALTFVRACGGTSLGVAYSLMLSDVTLAGGIPSVAARSGCIMLPITRSIAELYDSHPGPTAPLLGRFLMTSLYQCSVVACAMFITGQAGNLLAANLAGEVAGVTVTWTSWFMAGLVPGVASCLAIPYVTYRLVPPGIVRTPAAAEYARNELTAMGRVRGAEAITLAVFITVILLWITSAWHGLDVALVAFSGMCALMLANVLSWEIALSERSAWDMFVWYGGLFTMGELLNEAGSTEAFADWVSLSFGGIPWTAALLATVLVYFYAHYALASITTHVLAMFPPFVAMLIGIGAPPALVVYTLACLANLTAGLTHYGTTSGPMVYGVGYVELGDWWRVGFLASLVNLAIWLTIGFGWWKLLGFW
jgi:DASS family divalent anion:Na+ symporter